jgi:hypothetical protein
LSALVFSAQGWAEIGTGDTVAVFGAGLLLGLAVRRGVGPAECFRTCADPRKCRRVCNPRRNG